MHASPTEADAAAMRRNRNTARGNWTIEGNCFWRFLRDPDDLILVTMSATRFAIDAVEALLLIW